jgi:hypothetical protein
MIWSLLFAASPALAVVRVPLPDRTRSHQPLANQSYPLWTVPGAHPANPFEPLQQRLAIRDAWSMGVSWNTYTPLDDSEAIVEYGTDPFNLDQKVFANQSTFPTSFTWSHHAVLEGLQPKTEYHYRVAYSNCLKCNTL